MFEAVSKIVKKEKGTGVLSKRGTLLVLAMTALLIGGKDLIMTIL
jgi:hypothetical protein